MVVVLTWWIWLQLIGLAALPLAWWLLRCLPDRGHAFARPLGLLLATYVLWLGGALGLLRNSLGGVLVAVLAVAALSAWAARRLGGPAALRADLAAYWREHRWAVLTTEALFLLCLGGWSLYRAYSPDIATAGGEKFMEFAFVNAILRSPTFPPPDPWLSGFGISYYYFGYVMVAALTRLSGFPANLTFNVALAMLFSLTVTGAFSLVYNLVVGAGLGLRRWAAAGYGVLGAVLVAIVGNLEGFLEVLSARGIGSPAFWKWLDIQDLAGAATSSGLPDRFMWWWRGSRVLRDYDLLGNPIELIDEFPFFSFMLGDIHPHVLALPFGLLVLALALNLWRSAGQRPWLAPPPAGLSLPARLRAALRGLRDGGPEGLLWAVILGGMAFLNTWDFPIYLTVFLLAFCLAGWQRREAGLGPRAAVLTVGLAGVGVLLYLPFYLGFQSQAGGLLPSILFRTKWQQYLVMFGPLLAPALGLWGVSLAQWRRGGGWSALPVEGKAALGGALVLTLGLLVFGRVTTALLLVLLAGLSLALLHRRPASTDAQVVEPTSQGFALLLLLAGLGLTFVVEWVFLKDTFMNRMNTVFKFYFQAWVLMALAGGFAVPYVVRRAGRVSQAVFTVAFVVVFAAGMVYPLAAAPDRADGFRAAPTLDGTAWIARFWPAEHRAAAWLAVQEDGPATVLEANGGSYTFHGRVSAMTGMSTLLGWGGHELQWRGNYDEPGRREPVIERIYRELQPEAARPLLEEYDIDYVYVGALEREKFGLSPQAVEKFRAFMELVYDEGDVRIYRRAGW
ncbi:MAG: hypothetical protein GX605_05775 [Chloroflexi bacterium]|nr:hypothetical protein [Chloroflexota bacterium]